MKKIATAIYHKLNVTYLLLFILIIFGIINHLSENLILTESFYRVLKGNLDKEVLDQVVRKIKRFAIIKLLWLDLIPLLYILFTAVCLFTAFTTTIFKITFRKVLKISTVAYLVFFIPHITKFLYFLSIDQNFTLKEYNDFIFASLMPLYNSQSDDYWIKSLFETFTLFELLYWLILALGVRFYTNWDFDKSLKLVLSGYGLGLFFLVTIKVFLVLVYFDS
jgi:hypothetical protein